MAELAKTHSATTSNATLRARHTAAVPRGIATKSVYAAKAKNAEIWDVEGKRYIDFAAGIAVVNTGHCHPRIMAAVSSQMQDFTHTCFNVAPYEEYIAVAERLNKAVPGDFEKKTMFVTTGAEAVENCVKIARVATGRTAIIAFNGAFHGRTMMGMALTGKVVPYKRGFGPFPAEVHHAAYPKPYYDISVEDAMAGLKDLFSSAVDPARVAAVIIEPVQGEGGFYVAPFAYLQALRKLCDEHGILFVADEIQTGMGRTGKMFAIEHSGVIPDLTCIAKGLGGGFPLAAVTGRADLMDAALPGGLGGTYAGSPVGLSAAGAVFDVIEDEKLCERATELGTLIKGRLEAMQKMNEFSCIGDVRGLGNMVAVELVSDRVSKKPAAELTAAVVAKCQEKGLLILTCGPSANVIRFLCPLTTEMGVANEGLDLFESAMRDAVGV
jgi:4-aminobutyrate aminotransferase